MNRITLILAGVIVTHLEITQEQLAAINAAKVANPPLKEYRMTYHRCGAWATVWRLFAGDDGEATYHANKYMASLKSMRFVRHALFCGDRMVKDYGGGVSRRP